MAVQPGNVQAAGCNEWSCNCYVSMSDNGGSFFGLVLATSVCCSSQPAVG